MIFLIYIHGIVGYISSINEWIALFIFVEGLLARYILLFMQNPVFLSKSIATVHIHTTTIADTTTRQMIHHIDISKNNTCSWIPAVLQQRYRYLQIFDCNVQRHVLLISTYSYMSVQDWLQS